MGAFWPFHVFIYLFFTIPTTERFLAPITCQCEVHIDILYVFYNDFCFGTENIAWLHKKCALATGRIYGIFWQA